MAIPNFLEEVRTAQDLFPNEWRSAHTGGPGTEDFIRLLAARLHAMDPRCGLNGKRGDPRDISDDVIAIRGEGSAVDLVNGGPMEIIDVIVGAGGPNPQPAWSVAPGGPGDKGTWVAPSPGPTPQPQQGQGPAPVVNLQPVLTAIAALDAKFNDVGIKLDATRHALDAIKAAAEKASADARDAASRTAGIDATVNDSRRRLEDIVRGIDLARQDIGRLV
jgi:hypothetical protein